MIPEIKNLIDTVDSSQMNETDKEEFWDKIVSKQIFLAEKLAPELSDENLEKKRDTLFFVIEKTNVMKTVKNNLVGVMTGTEIMKEFIRVMDDI